MNYSEKEKLQERKNYNEKEIFIKRKKERKRNVERTDINNNRGNLCK